MNRNERSLRIILKLAAFIVLVIIFAIALTGCSAIRNAISTVTGNLVGNSYTVMAYDDFGNQVMTAAGDKISLETEKDTAGNNSSYLTVTIDGKEWSHVGNTLVFIEDGADLITDFSENIDIGSNTGSTGLIAIDRKINDFRNMFGQESIVAVYSQAGVPICLLQGDDCYKEIPSDLPTMTRLNIDGKSVYVYRANIDIIPADLIR